MGAMIPARLPRCPYPGCAWRYHCGPDRPCPHHQDEDDICRAAIELGLDPDDNAKSAWPTESDMT